MRLRKAIPVTLALVLAAGVAVCTAAASTRANAAARAKASGSAAKSKARVKRSRYSRRRERGQTAPAPERISEIQQALAKDGSFTGSPNGKWDGSTAQAMRKFQAAHGLNPTGKLDALTLQKLGLGSKTAGIAAPTPPPNAASSLLSPPGSTQTTRQ